MTNFERRQAAAAQRHTSGIVCGAGYSPSADPYVRGRQAAEAGEPRELPMCKSTGRSVKYSDEDRELFFTGYDERTAEMSEHQREAKVRTVLCKRLKVPTLNG